MSPRHPAADEFAHSLCCPLFGRPPQRRDLWRRVGEMGWIGATHGSRLLGHMVIRAFRPGSESRASVCGRCLTDLLEALGPTFVKVGQVLSSRPDLLPHDVIVHLRRLQQDVTPFPVDQLRPALEAALGTKASAFASIDPEPVAAASVANVYRAKLHDGQTVALKVRRPGLWSTVHYDLIILKAIAGVFQRLPALRVVPVSGAAEEVAQAIRRQLNFAEEADNNRRFHDNFRDYPGVRIPVLVEDLRARSVLTMEFLPELRRIDALAPGDEQAERVALLGLRVLYKMIFLDGLVHVDMHPGNIFVTPGGEFVFLDLGLVAELDPEQRRQFAEFFVAIATNDGRTCARILIETARSCAPGFDPAAFSTAMAQLIDRYSGLDAAAFQVARFVRDLFDVQRRHGLTGSTDFTLVIVSLAVFEGIVKKISPGLDFQAEARAFLLSAPAVFDRALVP